VWAFSLARVLKRVIEPVGRGSAFVAAATLCVVVLLIVVDVTGRYVLRMPVRGSVELVEVMMIIIIFGGMAATALAKGHVRVDVLIGRFPPTAQLVITACANLLTVGIVAIISWRNFAEGLYLESSHYVTLMLQLPLWTFAIVSSFFIGVFAIAFLVDFFESLGELIASGTRNCLWLIPGILVVIALFVLSFNPDMLPFKIDPGTFGLFGFLLLFSLIFLRVYIGAAMGMITLLGTACMTSTGAGLAVLGMTSQTIASQFTWSAIPLFMVMGITVSVVGFSRQLYHTAYTWLGHMPGGLASATVGACGAFAAITGESLPGVVTFSEIALPEMKAYNYDAKLATGCVCAGATIGVLIPPSLGFIVYGILVEQSIGKLFIAGILPGIILTAAFILSIFIRCWRNPNLGPPGPATSLWEKAKSLQGSWSTAVLFILVIGGLYVGIFTPTEAGAVGAFTAIVLAATTRKITSVRSVWDGVVHATQTTAMVFFIFIYANALTNFFATTKLPFAVSEFIAGLAVPPLVTLFGIMLMYFFLGCIMNFIPALILTLPIIYPTVMNLGFDPIWFGVLIVVMLETALLTPPIGMNVFALSGIVQRSGIYNISMYSIFAGVAPFWLVLLGVIALLIAFPQIALFLPNLMMGG